MSVVEFVARRATRSVSPGLSIRAATKGLKGGNRRIRPFEGIGRRGLHGRNIRHRQRASMRAPHIRRHLRCHDRSASRRAEPRRRRHERGRNGDAAWAFRHSQGGGNDHGRTRHTALQTRGRHSALRPCLDGRSHRGHPRGQGGRACRDLRHRAPYFALNEGAVGDYRTFAKLSPLRAEEDRLAVVEELRRNHRRHRLRPRAATRSPSACPSSRRPNSVGLETRCPSAWSFTQQTDGAGRNTVLRGSG